jgi:hypothetical protein
MCVPRQSYFASLGCHCQVANTCILPSLLQDEPRPTDVSSAPGASRPAGATPAERASSSNSDMGATSDLWQKQRSACRTCSSRQSLLSPTTAEEDRHRLSKMDWTQHQLGKSSRAPTMAWLCRGRAAPAWHHLSRGNSGNRRLGMQQRTPHR